MIMDAYLDAGDGIYLHYLDAGEGRPVLFVPGWTCQADHFRTQIRMLADAGWRGVSFDPVDHGESDHDPTCITYAQQADAIDAVIEGLELDGVVLAGWSFGATACWEYLRTYGFDRIAAFVDIDNPPLALNEDRTEYRGNSAAGFQRQMDEYLVDEAGFRRFVEEKFLDGIFFNTPPTDPAVRTAFVEGSLRVPLDIARALFEDGHKADERDMMEEAATRLPCLFFVADYRHEQGIRCLARDYPDARIEAFGNHMMFWEHPERFFEALTSFLKDNGLD